MPWNIMFFEPSKVYDYVMHSDEWNTIISNPNRNNLGILGKVIRFNCLRTKQTYIFSFSTICAKYLIQIQQISAIAKDTEIFLEERIFQINNKKQIQKAVLAFMKLILTGSGCSHDDIQIKKTKKDKNRAFSVTNAFASIDNFTTTMHILNYIMDIAMMQMVLIKSSKLYWIDLCRLFSTHPDLTGFKFKREKHLIRFFSKNEPIHDALMDKKKYIQTWRINRYGWNTVLSECMKDYVINFDKILNYFIQIPFVDVEG